MLNARIDDPTERGVQMDEKIQSLKEELRADIEAQSPRARGRRRLGQQSPGLSGANSLGMKDGSPISMHEKALELEEDLAGL